MQKNGAYISLFQLLARQIPHFSPQMRHNARQSDYNMCLRKMENPKRLRRATRKMRKDLIVNLNHVIMYDVHIVFFRTLT